MQGLMDLGRIPPQRPIVTPEMVRRIRKDESRFYEEQARAYDDWYYSVMSTCWVPAPACGDVPGLLQWNIRNFNPTILGVKINENFGILDYDLDFPIVRYPPGVILDELGYY
jgi:hypothetical protein